MNTPRKIAASAVVAALTIGTVQLPAASDEHRPADAEQALPGINEEDAPFSVTYIANTWLQRIVVWGAMGHRRAEGTSAGTLSLEEARTRTEDPSATTQAEPEPAEPESATTPVKDVASDAAASYTTADGDVIDAARLQAFLVPRDAPLAQYAEEIVAAGIKYEVDPRLVVAISIIESGGGQRLPASTHNAWGWSGSGPHGLKSWSSWPAAIDDYTERLGRLYDTNNIDAAMAEKYCPPNAVKWLSVVQYVFQAI